MFVGWMRFLGRKWKAVAWDRDELECHRKLYEEIPKKRYRGAVVTRVVLPEGVPPVGPRKSEVGHEPF